MNRNSRLEKKQMINSWKRHALCDWVLRYKWNSWEFEHVMRNSMGNGIWSIYIDKYFESSKFVFWQEWQWWKSNGRDRQKPQRTHKMRVRVKCLYFEIFIVVNRPYCPGLQRWQTIDIWPLRYLSFSILKQPWEV